MINVKDKAPDFALKNKDGETVVLSELVKDGSVIVYFYPADFSPVCTAEACSFRDSFAGIQTAGANLVGVSPQSVKSHQRFSSAFSLPFPLLSDPDKKTIRAYGVDGLFGVGVRRATFLIDENMVVRNRAVSDVFLSSHADLVNQVAAAV
jgi:peroxiredoxin Q/BCP